MKRIVTVALLTLCGCSSYSSHMECGIGEGMSCASLYKINKAVDREAIDFELEESPSQTKGAQGRAPKAPEKTPRGMPTTVWIAPHQDSNGNAHGEKTIQIRPIPKIGDPSVNSGISGAHVQRVRSAPSTLVALGSSYFGTWLGNSRI